MVEYIYYTGIGSKENGMHTVEEFLDIMNKHFNVQCSEFLPDLDFKPCQQSKDMYVKLLADKYNIAPVLNKNGTKLKKSYKKKYKKLFKQCLKYKRYTKKRKCNLEEYIKFSGAEKE